MGYKPGDTYYGEFTTCRFDTGAAADADSPPTVIATRNGVDDLTFSLSSTKIDTGRYKVTGAIPATYASGNAVQICVNATVGSVVGKCVIDGFVLDGKRISDLNDPTAAPTAAQIRTELDANSTKLANLDAAVSSRSTYNGGAVASVQAPVAVDLNQAIPLVNAENTVGDCLNAARAQGFGRWTKLEKTLTLYGPDGTTVVRTFTLDDASNPTERT
jgi:hypothetical protein